MLFFVCCVLACSALTASDVPEFQEYTDAQNTSVDKAVKWLLKAQNNDGSWGLDVKSSGDITCTALATLALMAGGTSEREGASGESVKAVRKGIEYIEKAGRAAREDITRGETTLIQRKLGATVHNFTAVVFLTQIYGMRSVDVSGQAAEEMKQMLEKLSAIIAKRQEADGSWHKDTWGSLKATGMAWLALHFAAQTGVPIKNAAVDKTVKFIRSQYNPGTKLFDGAGKMQSYQALYATATSVRVMVGTGFGREKSTLDAIDTFISKCKSGDWGQMFLTVEGEDYFSALTMTEALMQQKDDEARWQNWFGYIRAALLKRQNADGTWTTTACITGKTFPTACAILVLQAPNRLLPYE
jgi:prenyltransferase beta subunit